MDIKVYTPDEVAEILKVTPATIRDMLRKGKLKGTQIGRHWRVTEEEIRRFLEEN